jgi:hypothetical protein
VSLYLYLNNGIFLKSSTADCSISSPLPKIVFIFLEETALNSDAFTRLVQLIE